MAETDTVLAARVGGREIMFRASIFIEGELFEERVLRACVDLAGPLPRGYGDGISMLELAQQLAPDLGMSPSELPADEAALSFRVTGPLGEAVRGLTAEGYLENEVFNFSYWSIRPTTRGRRKVTTPAKDELRAALEEVKQLRRRIEVLETSLGQLVEDRDRRRLSPCCSRWSEACQHLS
jgi:hypothetical protein